MRLILLIAFRNLFRKKGRSILMGLGICVAVVYMILVNALTHGLYSNVINKMVESNILGHLTVNIIEKDGSTKRAIIRNRDAMISIIKDKIPNIKDISESVNTYAFAIGNNHGSVLRLNGIKAESVETISDIAVLSGDLKSFANRSVENPLILEKNMADELKVKPGDMVKVKLNTVYGQVQTARLCVVAIVEYRNPFMGDLMPGGIPLKSLKEILDLKQDETQQLNIVLKKLNNSDEAIIAADKLHSEFLSKNNHAITASIPKPWKLAERTYSEADHEKKQREIRRASYNGSILDIASMQEYDARTFSGEKNAAATGFIAMLIVIVIILVGILNTMRMNIRERTTEIGTVRAIGMKRKTVIRTLIAEVFLLSIFFTVIGYFVAYGLMELLQIIQFHPTNMNLSVILNNGHPVFKIPVATIVFDIILAIFLLMFSAWLPARKAVKTTVAEALGHYE
jgi:putative ABC transport system permease protein